MRDEYDIRGGVRGALCPMPPGYTRVAIRMDDEVLDWFRDKVNRAGGGDYVRLINDALREHIRKRETVEEMLRRIVREELGRVRAERGRSQGRRRALGVLRRLGSERRR
jgi:hypothetical protein